MPIAAVGKALVPFLFVTPNLNQHGTPWFRARFGCRKPVRDTLLLIICLIMLFAFPSTKVFSQGLGINIVTPDPSSLLDLSSTEKGMLVPRMTTAQRNAIASPANGLLVYDTDMELFYYNSGTSASPLWVFINSGAQSANTRVKILPGDFMATARDIGGKAQPKGFGYDNISGTNTNYGVVMADNNTQLVAFVEIPSGYKATHARVYGNDTGVSFEVFESDISTGNLTSKGSANVGSEADMTDVDCSSTNFLVIVIYFDQKEADKAYGGYVTIAPI